MLQIEIFITKLHDGQIYPKQIELLCSFFVCLTNNCKCPTRFTKIDSLSSLCNKEENVPLLSFILRID